MAEKMYQNVSFEKLPKSRIKITGEVTVAALKKVHNETLEETIKVAEVPGFRVGKAPKHMVEKHVGEMKILERAAGIALEDVYHEIIKDKAEAEGFRPIGYPHITVTKLAADNPLGFTMETDVMPEIKDIEYKKIAKTAAADVKDAPETVEEAEIDTVIEDLRKRLAVEVAASEESTTETGTEVEKSETEKKKILPEVNDDFVKQFGDFKSVADFREHTRKNIAEHKKQEVREKRRGAIAEKLIAEAKFEVPDVFIESELETMTNRFKHDVEHSGMSFADYLKAVQKTEQEIQTEWRPSAERRARLELVLKHIAREEKIEPDEEKVKKEVEHIVSHHKGADRFSVRMFVENQLKNGMVFELLEKEAGLKAD